MSQHQETMVPCIFQWFGRIRYKLEFQLLSDRLNKEETRDLGDSASKVFETSDPERDGGPTLSLLGQFLLFLDANSVQFRNQNIFMECNG